MKNISQIAALVIAALSCSAYAEVFILEKNNGELLEFDVETIKEMRFKTEEEQTGNLAPETVEIVDLGLSVCWASHNVGASSPDQVGDYVMWGDTKTSEWYSWSYYPYGNSQNITKYSGTDGLVYLQSSDDYASIKWGTDWRMPTQEEANELIENCEIEFNVEVNGHPGVRLTSKVSGYEDKSIFIPATGYIQDEYNLDPYNAYLWTNTVGRGWYQFAMTLTFKNVGDYAGQAIVPAVYRYLGQTIRPVYTKEIEEPAAETEVDLGLSVNWATANVGATAPTEIGTYVAWGETASKDNYSWSTYAHGTGSTSISKYGKTDKVTVLEAADDAATTIMGEGWRTPTSAEYTELIQNCEIAIDEVDGVKGFRFTSKVSGYEDKSIFFPLTGEKQSTGVSNPEAMLNMWSSTLCGTSLLNQGKAYGFNVTILDSSPEVKSNDRCYGRPVRGVKAK